MTPEPRLQKPPTQAIATRGPTGPEILGQVTEFALCWTIPGYAFYAAVVRMGDVPKKEQGHQAF